ncbi:MAG: DUF3307 domain-containing protein [Anaerolineae bacterium]
MLLAHLVGDYILQWDQLALWKSKELKGILVHGLVVFTVTWTFSLPIDPTWWWGVLFISAAHLLIDGAQLYVELPVAPLVRFILDQSAHGVVIIAALIARGDLAFFSLTADLANSLQSNRALSFLLGYAFISMPAWVIIKFVAYGLVRGTAPEFPGRTNKYIGILERGLITTITILGQSLLAPLVVVPRLVVEWSRVRRANETAVYLVELLVSTALAVAVGLALSRL